MDISNSPAQIIYLAEEIERYCEKIYGMEKYIKQLPMGLTSKD